MYKIMLADDEGIVLDSLSFILKKEFGEECMIDSAKTGRSVIELAERFRPDIAIMDIQMPGINGIDAMKEIKSTNSKVIFIVMSAYDKFDYAKEAINLGVLDYLNKPVDKSEIIAVVKRAMEIIDKERSKRKKDLIDREKMETVVPVIESGFVSNLLFREFFEEDILNYKNLLGIKENYGYMMALVFGEEQEGNHMTNAVGSSVRVQSKMREIRETIRGYFPGIVGAAMSNKIAVFIPTDHESFTYDERIEIIEQARVMVRKMRQRFDIAFRAGFGRICTLDKAMESYNDALSALTGSSGTVAHADDLPIGCDYEDNYPTATEHAIFDSVEKGDVNGAIAACNQFFDWMQENYGAYINDIRLKVLEFALYAERLAYQNGGMVYEFRSRTDYLPRLMGMNDPEQLRAWFIDRISDACRNIMTRKEERSVSVIDLAKEYINTHYQKDISLDEVSEHVDISPYYFSKIFKTETGQNFIEYLTMIRMDKAKELLRESDLSMKEICAEVGYSDPNYFSRTFKKNVGQTPTEYKESR